MYMCRYLIILVPLLHLIVQRLVPIPVRLIPKPLTTAMAKVEELLKLLMEREEATDPILPYLILYRAAYIGMVRGNTLYLPCTLFFTTHVIFCHK